MDLLTQTKQLIKQFKLSPDKFKGQNFCVDQRVLTAMIKYAGVNQQSNVLEVGPGFGFLTGELCQKARKVMAVELDHKLFGVVKKFENVYQNLEVVNQDIMKFEVASAKFENYKIVANLPYSITSAFLKKFLATEPKPESLTLLLQRAVAERICAGPGQMSLLAVSVQLYSQPAIQEIVKAEAFWPQPAVDSAIITFDHLQPFPYARAIDEKTFWQVVRAGFCSKRKQLHNNLKNSFHLTNQQTEKLFQISGLNPIIRAQQLRLKEWLVLAGAYQQILN